MILAGNIGSTNSLLGVFKGGEKEPLVKKEFPGKNYSSLELLVEEFLQELSLDEPIYSACFGIGGPVKNGTGNIRSLSWNIVDKNMCALLMRLCWKVDDNSLCENQATRMPVEVINNLGAVDFNNLEPTELVDINPNSKQPEEESDHFRQNRAWIAPKTGLGEALFCWDRYEKRFRPLATEGGHADFAPRNPLEDELLGFLRQHFKPVVACQRVLSRLGLSYIYQFFKAKNGATGLAALDELIKQKDSVQATTVLIEAALKKENAECVQALGMFVSILGAETGNLALKHLALGGVYVGGPIALEIVDKLQDGIFMKAFKQREVQDIVELMDSIPIMVVTNPDIRFQGIAKRAFRKEGMGIVIHNKVVT